MRRVILLLLVFLLSGCFSMQKIPPKLPTVPASSSELVGLLSGVNWLFGVLILLIVGGITMAIIFKAKEGIAIAVASFIGAGLIVAFACWAKVIGLIVIGLAIFLIIWAMKNLKDVGFFAVKYGEGLKLRLGADQIESYNATIQQPKRVQKAIERVKGD